MRRSFLPLVLALGGCMHEPLMQGNVLHPEKVRQIAPGMTRAEVIGRLGAPVYEDRLHPDRLVYVELREVDGKTVRRRLVVHLDAAGRVARVER